MNRKDITGQRKGKWEVLKRLEGYPTKYLCKCDCGTVKKVYYNNLQSGYSTGCLQCALKQTILGNRKHGQSKSRTYRQWRYLKERDRLAEKWAYSFHDFYKTIGDLKKRQTVRPIRYNEKIGPDNYQVVHEKTALHFSKKVFVHQDMAMSAAGWAKHLGISRERFRQRVNAGLPPERLFAKNNQFVGQNLKV